MLGEHQVHAARRGGTDSLSAAPPRVFAPAADFELAIKSKPG